MNAWIVVLAHLKANVLKPVESKRESIKDVCIKLSKII